ncbi:MAG TPA: 30S ribosomal protein S3ae [Candidatus Bathyarchaeia archaeon]|nr:MAG: 30S ribosomal protein S3ae [Candidatus Bathyarchaeota archaeon RBG_16_48_13]HJX24274.1 30S ribosomal protein S3ae [Candidatus Bathyarchaeia archaeon]
MPKAEKKKIKDKWRDKTWFSISAPPYFGGNIVALAPCNDSVEILNRAVETTLYDVTGDFSQQHIKLYFKTADVKGSKVDTVFKGHEYSRDYLRSLVRRGSTRIEGIYKVTLGDGHQMRVSAIAFTASRIKQAQGHSIRRIMRETLETKASTLGFDNFVQEAVLGKIASEIFNEAKKIAPLRHVGIQKSKLIFSPTVGDQGAKKEETEEKEKP